MAKGIFFVASLLLAPTSAFLAQTALSQLVDRAHVARRTGPIMATPASYSVVSDEIAIVGTVTQRQISELAPHFKSWLYVARDTFPDMGLGGGQFGVALSRPHLKAAHVPLDCKELTLETSEKVLSTLDALPRPTIISCTSNHRAAAVATMYEAVKNQMTPEQTLAMAETRRMGFLKSQVLTEWVLGTVAAAKAASTPSAIIVKPTVSTPHKELVNSL